MSNQATDATHRAGMMDFINGREQSSCDAFMCGYRTMRSENLGNSLNGNVEVLKIRQRSSSSEK